MSRINGEGFRPGQGAENSSHNIWELLKKVGEEVSSAQQFLEVKIEVFYEHRIVVLFVICSNLCVSGWFSECIGFIRYFP